MKKYSALALSIFLTSMTAEARRPLQPDPVEPPPPTVNPVIVPVVEQAVQTMANRLLLVDGVFFSKYATISK